MIKKLFNTDNKALKKAKKVHEKIKLNFHENHNEHGEMISRLHYKTHRQLILSPHFYEFRELEEYLNLPVLIRYITELRKGDFLNYGKADPSWIRPAKFCSMSLSNNNRIYFDNKPTVVNAGQIIEFDPLEDYYLPEIKGSTKIWIVWMIPHWYETGFELVKEWD